jgi:hypothetical protein
LTLESLSAFATALGTLILAVATFFSTRSANRAARTAELAVLEQQRPLLMNSKLEDARQKIMFQDAHWVHLDGGAASVEATDGVVYFVISLRNVGPGLAVLQGWFPHPGRRVAAEDHPPVDRFRSHTRDLYVPANDIGLWQGALRDPADPLVDSFREAVDGAGTVTVDLLYSDVQGGQRTITRFSLVPVGEGRRLGAVVRHWMLDRPNPR